MSPSNWTSTTAPMTWVTRPMALLGVGLVAMSLCSSHPLEARHARLAAGGPAAGAFRAEAVLQGFCARDDFEQFLGDHTLSLPLVDQTQTSDHAPRLSTEERAVGKNV